MLNKLEVTRSLAKLSPGSVVIVEVITPAGQKSKFKSTYVGFMPNKFILLQMPDLNKNPRLISQIKNSSGCTVRGLSEGNEGAVIAFVSEVKSEIRLPTAMLVLAIPERVETQPLRKVTRIDTNIMVEAQIDHKNWPGKISNLSALGCQLSFNSSKHWDTPAGSKINLTVIDANFTQIEPIEATVCNIKVQPNAIHVGVEFTPDSKPTAMILLNQVIFV